MLLPNETWREIFLFHKRKSLESTLKLVCAQFRNLIDSLSDAPYLVIAEMPIEGVIQWELSKLPRNDSSFPKMLFLLPSGDPFVPKYLRIRDILFCSKALRFLTGLSGTKELFKTIPVTLRVINCLRTAFIKWELSRFIIDMRECYNRCLLAHLLDEGGASGSAMIQLDLCNHQRTATVDNVLDVVLTSNAVKNCRELEIVVHMSALQQLGVIKIIDWLHGSSPLYIGRKSLYLNIVGDTALIPLIDAFQENLLQRFHDSDGDVQAYIFFLSNNQYSFGEEITTDRRYVHRERGDLLNFYGSAETLIFERKKMGESALMFCE